MSIRKTKSVQRLTNVASWVGQHGATIEKCLQGAATVFAGFAAIHAALNPPEEKEKPASKPEE